MRKLVFSTLSLMIFLVPSASFAESLEGSVPIYVSCYHLVPDNQNLVTSIFRVGRGALEDGMFEHAGDYSVDGTTGISVHGTPGQGKDITAQWQELLLADGVDADRVHRAGCAMGRSVEAFLAARRNEIRDHPSRRIDEARFNSWVPGPGIYGNYVAEVWDWGGRKLSDRQLGRSGAAETSPRAKGTVSTKSEDRQVSTVPKGPTPNQLKYQRELEEYNARLAEIEKIKTNTAAKHAADTAAAAAELARHQRELAVASAARKQYEAELAAHQQRVRDMETKQDREAKVDWREAVVVCTLNPTDGQTRFGNWRCDGPLQMTYAKLGNPGQALAVEALVPLSQACGGSREAVRDLGMVGDARLLGCSYGIHPKSTSGFPLDAAAKHGIGFVPGRATYRCPAYQSGCRSQ